MLNNLQSNQSDPLAPSPMILATQDKVKGGSPKLSHAFNPKDISFGRKVELGKSTAAGQNQHKGENDVYNYAGAEDSISFTLEFDSTEDDTDLYDEFAGLWTLTMPINDPEKKKRLPVVLMTLGKLKFAGFICGVDFSVSLFDKKLRAKRGSAKVSMKGRLALPGHDDPLAKFKEINSIK